MKIVDKSRPCRVTDPIPKRRGDNPNTHESLDLWLFGQDGLPMQERNRAARAYRLRYTMGLVVAA